MFSNMLKPTIATLAIVGFVACGAPARSAIVAEHYQLPISPPQDQGDSDLCWVYATLSMLETNYLVKHPQSKILLSRGALQRLSIADRFARMIAGEPPHLEDGGLAVDALRLIKQGGLVAGADYHGVVDSDSLFPAIASRLAALTDKTNKLTTLDESLSADLGDLPAHTTLDGQTLSLAALADELLGAEDWTEYDVAAGPERVAPSDDPDARPETRVHYASLETIEKLIHRSLARGEAVVWGSTDDHALLIYGADYDASGRALAYWVKDSFAPYTYRAPADDIRRVLTDVTVSEQAAAETAVN